MPLASTLPNPPLTWNMPSASILIIVDFKVISVGVILMLLPPTLSSIDLAASIVLVPALILMVWFPCGNRQRVVALVDLDLAIAGCDLVGIVALGDDDVAIALLDGDLLVAFFDRFGPVLPDFDRLAAVCRFLVADDQLLVVVDLDGLVALVFLLEADLQRVVVFDDAIEVLLGVEVDLLGVLLVLEPQFVELLRRALLGRPRLDAALGLLSGSV